MDDVHTGRTDHLEHLQTGASQLDAVDTAGGAKDSPNPLVPPQNPQVDAQEPRGQEMEAYRQKIEADHQKALEYQAKVTAEGKADNWLNTELAKHLELLDDTTKQVIQYASSKSYASLVEKEAELKREIAKGYLKGKDYSHLDLTSAQKSRIEAMSFEGYQELREAEERHHQRQATQALNNGLKTEAELKRMSSHDKAIYQAERRGLDSYKARYENAVHAKNGN